MSQIIRASGRAAGVRSRIVRPEGPLIFDGLCFRRPFAEEHGLSGNRISAMLRRGELRQVIRGAYVDVRRPDSPALRAEALALVCPPGAVVARRSAAWLYGVDPRSPSEYGQVLDAECLVPVSRTPMRYTGVRCFQSRLDDDVASVRGLRVTNPHRTAVDLLRYLPPHMGLGVADALAHLGLTTAERLVVEVERWRGERNIAQARRLAGLVEAGAESMGESWTRLRIVDAGFPRPTVQIPIAVPDGPTYRLDMGFLEQKKAVEYDGQEDHTEPEDVRHDRFRRDRITTVTGWLILPVTRGEILGRSLAFEWGLGELLGLEPVISRRLW